MIVGHGIDIEELSRLAEACDKDSRFARRVLTEKEYAYYQQLTGKRQLTFLAGRWSAKEAFAKAYGTGIVAGVGFQDIEILYNQKGAPVLTKSPFEGRSHVSISHTGNLVYASVILEEE